MGSLTDTKFAALRAQGYTGTMSDMLRAWLLANSGASSGTISDLWDALCTAQGIASGALPERKDALWTALGYASELEFWEAGGTLTSVVTLADIDAIWSAGGATKGIFRDLRMPETMYNDDAGATLVDGLGGEVVRSYRDQTTLGAGHLCINTTASQAGLWLGPQGMVASGTTVSGAINGNSYAVDGMNTGYSFVLAVKVTEAYRLAYTRTVMTVGTSPGVCSVSFRTVSTGVLQIGLGFNSGITYYDVTSNLSADDVLVAIVTGDDVSPSTSADCTVYANNTSVHTRSAVNTSTAVLTSFPGSMAYSTDRQDALALGVGYLNRLLTDEERQTITDYFTQNAGEAIVDESARTPQLQLDGDGSSLGQLDLTLAADLQTFEQTLASADPVASYVGIPDLPFGAGSINPGSDIMAFGFEVYDHTGATADIFTGNTFAGFGLLWNSGAGNLYIGHHLVGSTNRGVRSSVYGSWTPPTDTRTLGRELGLHPTPHIMYFNGATGQIGWMYYNGSFWYDRGYVTGGTFSGNVTPYIFVDNDANPIPALDGAVVRGRLRTDLQFLRANSPPLPAGTKAIDGTVI